ncbi:mCG140970, isoform CRA_a [Mus musculus]|uniref:Uncharacterized protein n=1 Tax=Mus musculus TaxID=10090 RepID=Q9D578_MOUSE|nr:mCG140970, isoform CRA_a [Mus musculus]BAB29939.1 unnamed protein product [Mus musculus]
MSCPFSSLIQQHRVQYRGQTKQPNRPPLPLGLLPPGRVSLSSSQARLQGTPRNWTTSGCPFLAAYIKAVHPFSEVSLRRDGEWLSIPANFATFPSAAELWSSEIISFLGFLLTEDISSFKKKMR